MRGLALLEVGLRDLFGGAVFDVLEFVFTVAFESFEVFCDSVFAIAECWLTRGDNGVFHV